jgi:hypothetical protein
MSSRFSTQIIVHSPLLGQAQTQSGSTALPARMSIRPMAILEVVRRRGRSWGLLAQYEESRLGVSR